MLELLHESLELVNLPYTILFFCSMIYWVFYLFGVLGADVLDIPSEGKTDLDVDTDLDPGGHSGVLTSAMRFLHAGDVPVTVILSSLSMFLWVISLVTNQLLDNSSIVIALGLVVPIVIGSAILTRLTLKPFVPLIKRAFDESGDVIELIGMACVVVSLEVSHRHGQAEVPLKGSPLLINVKTREGELLKKGEEAVVFGKDEEGVYLVSSLGSLAKD